MRAMSRPLMTAGQCSTSKLDPASGFISGARASSSGNARKVPFCHCRSTGGRDISAVGGDFTLPPGASPHSRRNVERRQGLADLLRIGGSRALKRIDQHEGLRESGRGIFETESPVRFLNSAFTFWASS